MIAGCFIIDIKFFIDIYLVYNKLQVFTKMSLLLQIHNFVLKFVGRDLVASNTNIRIIINNC